MSHTITPLGLAGLTTDCERHQEWKRREVPREVFLVTMIDRGRRLDEWFRIRRPLRGLPRDLRFWGSVSFPFSCLLSTGQGVGALEYLG